MKRYIAANGDRFYAVIYEESITSPAGVRKATTNRRRVAELAFAHGDSRTYSD